MTLTDFLLARIAEDEAAAKACAYSDSMHWTANVGYLSDVEGLYIGNHQSEDYSNMNDEAAVHVARWDPARVLAECAAKRRIVRMYEDAVQQLASAKAFDPHVAGLDMVIGLATTASHVAEMALKIAALPYADHPDFDAAWLPVSGPADQSSSRP